MKFSFFSIVMFATTLNIAGFLSKVAFKTASITFYNVAFVLCCVLSAVSFVLMLLDARWNYKNSGNKN